MNRFFIPSGFNDNHIWIDSDESHHMITVKRHNIGDYIVLFNGNGDECTGEITDIVRDEGAQIKARINIKEVRSVSKEIDLGITMAFSVPKGKRAGFVIQKCSELGIKRIVPLITERSIIRSNFNNKLEKWQRISIEASKQCGRNLVTEISDVVDFASLDNLVSSHKLSIIFSSGNGSLGLKKILHGNAVVNNILCIVGPEGGFSDDEIKRATEMGCNVARLTPQILRIETAVIAISAMLIYEYTF